MEEQLEKPEKKGNVTLLLGAEGCAELADRPWAREATEEEIAAFKEKLDTEGVSFGGQCIDKTGRPYFLMTITEEAPDAVWQRANCWLRALRL